MEVKNILNHIQIMITNISFCLLNDVTPVNHYHIIYEVFENQNLTIKYLFILNFKFVLHKSC